MSASEAVRQCLMHANDYCMNSRIGLGVLQHGLKPTKLLRRELIARSAVECDEIDAALDPMVVSLHYVIGRIVFQALLLDSRIVYPVGELSDVVRTRFAGRQLMVANGKKHRGVAKGTQLVRDEVRPGGLEISIHAELTGRAVRVHQHVLVKIIDSAKIAQVPVELGFVGMDAGGYLGHDDVATVARI